MKSIEELEAAIAETERQEALFRLADNHMETAWWILERVKLRGQLCTQMFKEIR